MTKILARYLLVMGFSYFIILFFESLAKMRFGKLGM